MVIGMGRTTAVAVGIGLLLFGGCAGAPAPEIELTAANAALKEAEEADAETYAPSLLQQARDKLAFARELTEEDDNLRARRLAEQAEVDAQLAEARARAEVANRNLREMQGAIQEMPLEAPVGAPTPLGS